MARNLVAVLAKQIMHRSVLVANKATSRSSSIPRGYIAVYAGETEKKRFVVPLSYLKESSFQELLSKAEEEYGFNHPMGGLTIPCREETFVDVISTLSRS